MRNLSPFPFLNIDLFAVTAESRMAAEEAQTHPRMMRVDLAIKDGSIEDAIAFYAASGRAPQLLVVEADQTGAALEDQLNRLAEHLPQQTHCAVIGREDKVRNYKHLKSLGVADYLASPIDAGDIIESIAEIFDPGRRGDGIVISLMPAVGGAGLSTIARNLARSVTAAGSKALIADLNPGFDSHLLGFNMQADDDATLAPIYNADSVTIDEQRIQNLTHEVDRDIRLLLAPRELAEPHKVNPDAIQQLIDIARKISPVTIIDLPRTWNAAVTTALQASNHVVIVMRPTLEGFQTAGALNKALRRMQHEPMLIANMMTNTSMAVHVVGQLSSVIPSPSIFTIGMDPVAFGKAAENGITLHEAMPRHPALTTINAIADRILGRSSRAVDIAPERSPLSLIQGFLSKAKRPARA